MFTSLRKTQGSRVSSRMRESKRQQKRTLRCESLEIRRLLVAEGDVFAINGTQDTSGLLGDVSGEVRWGDGTTTAATVSGVNPTGNLRVRFDYSLDNRNFFSGANQSRRGLLNLAANTIVSRFGDTLEAIAPAGPIQYTPQILHPGTGRQIDLAKNLRVAQNEIVIYPGSRNLPDAGGVRGLGGPGNLDFDSVRVTCMVQADCDRQLAEAEDQMETLEARGQSGAKGDNRTDIATSIGSISFDTNTNWFFGGTTNGIEPNEVDFVTVAMHEIAHVLGFGIERAGATTAWANLVRGGRFNGSAARAAYNGSGAVPVHDNHWDEIVTDQVMQDTLMAATIPLGARQLMTTLDFAAMNDLGWEVLTSRSTFSAEHRYPDDGTYPVTLVLSGSGAGELEIAQPDVRVTNVPPTLVGAPAQDVIVGTQLSITDIVSITDPGFRNTQSDPATDETFTYTINWGDNTDLDEGTATIDRVGNGNGDGALTMASFNGSHTYETTGSKRVVVTVTDDDGQSANVTVNVNVTAPPSLNLALSQTSVAEDDGNDAATLTITRSGPARSDAQTINLQSDDSSEATVPATVVIPADATFVEVPIAAVDDALLDGDITVNLTATGTGLEPDDIELLVQDRESLAASFTEPEVREDQPDAIVLFVSRSNTNVDEELVVRVSGTNTNQLNVQETITIEAGQRIGSVTLVPVDDDIAEAPLDLNLGFTAAPYAAASATIRIIDDEPPLFQNPAEQFDVNDNGGVTANDALLVINQLSARGGAADLNPANEQPGGVFYDSNGDYRITALDALVIINEIGRRANAAGSEQVVGIQGLSETDDDDESLMLQDLQFIAVAN